MRRIHRGLLGAAVIGSLVALGLLFSPGAVTERLGGLVFSPWFPAVLVGLYLLRPLLAWPITAISALVGYRYGVVVGLPVALLGVVLTSMPAYLAARYVRSDRRWVGRLADGSERYFAATGDLRGLIAARLAPAPAEATSAAAGVAGVPVAAFVLGSLVGELPWTVTALLAGESMRRATPDGPIVDPWLVLSGVLLAALVLAGPAYRLARRRTSGEWTDVGSG